MPGSGPGGQKINRSANCVRLQHRPTGLEVRVQETRSQALNRFYARRRLCELLEEEQLGRQSPKALLETKRRKQKQRRKRRSRSRIQPESGGKTNDERRGADGNE